MKRAPLLLVVIALNLVVLIVLAFVYPHLMVSPGPLVKEHAALETDCFACHAPWRGADAARCIECHAPGDIGLRTTRGVAIARDTRKVAFHQELIEQDCMACHSDHRGPRLARRSETPFSHGLVRTAVRERCSACHTAPTDTLHRDLQAECGQCHATRGWKPAEFEHARLAPAVLDRCESCHKAPTDRLHRQIQAGCKSCHQTQAWKPATFDHDKHFVLDSDHDATCVTCHTGNDYGRYTCYGCHEHTLQNVREKHVDEGIREFNDCVECHRSASEEPRRASGGAPRGRRERRESD